MRVTIPFPPLPPMPSSYRFFGTCQSESLPSTNSSFEKKSNVRYQGNKLVVELPECDGLPFNLTPVRIFELAPYRDEATKYGLPLDGK
ncbi:hypothetical protein AVEN_84128-1 [Araneus ventricosus]|uniref:Uncharacterized protein n=1 Tax=Araneus ventricosus TaxID=182803 RepID=A0A4Y2UC98_ARAVE|nr:hypothetical protein AVEN_84128-1 [Araneus ventricosus]